MKNAYIIIILVLIIAGLWFFAGKNNKLEAPTISDNASEVNEGESQNKADSDNKPILDTSIKVESNTNVPTKEFTVSAKNFSFSPSTITVKKGDHVKITFNNTQGFHDFKIDEFGVASKQAQSPDTEVLEFTADKTGSFQYYCSVGSHRAMGMWGTLKVE